MEGQCEVVDGLHWRVQRLLVAERATYRFIRHSDLAGQIRTPGDFAAALGLDIDCVTKTLLIRTVPTDEFYLVVLSTGRRSKLEALAERVSSKRCILASRDELSQRLDYPALGVSPLAARDIKVFIDQRLQSAENIWIGAGAIGVEIEMTPAELQRLTAAEWLALS